MELSKEEVLVLAQAVKKAENDRIQELMDAQLAFVGGGIGETTL